MATSPKRPKEMNEIINRIVKLIRSESKSDSSRSITSEEENEILITALQAYESLSDKEIKSNGKILIEYQKNFHEITEEFTLPRPDLQGKVQV